MSSTALIVGAGSGISAALARHLAKDGYRVALAARNTDKLASLAKETGATIRTIGTHGNETLSDALLGQRQGQVENLLFAPSPGLCAGQMQDTRIDQDNTS